MLHRPFLCMFTATWDILSWVLLCHRDKSLCVINVLWLNRRCSSVIRLQITPHDRDVAANFVKKTALLVMSKIKNRLWTSGRFSKHRFSVKRNRTIWNIKSKKKKKTIKTSAPLAVPCGVSKASAQGGKKLLKLGPYTIRAVWNLFPPIWLFFDRAS